jgi:hypothetical protein
MAEAGNGPSGGDTTGSDGPPGPETDGRTSIDETSGDKTSSDPSSGDGTDGKESGKSGFKDALGQGKRGRRARAGDPLGGLFADIKDGDLDLVYVEPDHDYQRACEVLRDRRVVVLQGRPGSGRHAMARHLLLHGLRRDGVELERVVEIPSTAELANLSPFQRRSGHLLERCPPERARSLRARDLRSAADTLAKWEGYLVVTVDDAVTVLAGEPRDQVGLVACGRAPDVRRVLERHLEYYLRRQGGLWEEDRRWLDGDTVRTHLARHAALPETVTLARDLARRMAGDQAPGRSQRLDELLDLDETPGPPDTPERQARRLLEGSWDVEHWSHVIALAVFDGERAQIVTDAAALLAKRLAPAEPRDNAAWRPGPARGDWLERAGAEQFEALEHAILFNRSRAPHVRFKGSSVRTAVLDRVWNQLDELRGPVRGWLDELVDDPDPEVREETAMAVAYLASHGLGYVLERLLNPWIRRGGSAREVAAIALGVLGRDDARFTGPVLGLLSQWARWGDGAWRETAALAHGLAIGQDKPDLALRELRALAMREGTGPAVAAAVCELFRRSRHREVLEALGEWTSRPERVTWRPAEQRLRRTGLEAFLQTTRVYEETPRWPFLVCLAEPGGDLRERIIVLWRRALADDLIGERAGGMLCGWAREADVQAAATDGEPPELVGALARLAAGVADQGPGNRGRLRQALNRCATAEDDPSTVARQLVDRLG